ncbi:aldehyde dehydrogenase (NADP(+)) [Chitinophaga japonensis]|uniref:NADP-dependent aldehyde dehydrogenase n=1 Tax=Chitinophaga japonensis TaxID=104662 RepID=A0A562T861_CHIJA|nr:aldehyde dehydrogenase (NADP(+)) [Chitinophaga japonensis]TWI89050.1 NADP-dependent aldehyde dehydrogenase [Chitinophaga japonensis]
MINVDTVMQQSAAAFEQYKKVPAAGRAVFLETIADELETLRESLVVIAGRETNLPPARLNGELTRTTNQLKLFARLIREGSWVEAVIDSANPASTPPRPDIRKMLMPVGPVVVFGASNFPFAFSTAGGDTASVLAAGATAVIKGHPAHAETSLQVFGAIEAAIRKTNMPAHTVQHVAQPGNTIGKELVMHPLTTGVGFTGSFQGGRALLGYANQRENPIPVFAEMSSVNPVVFLPDTLEKNAASLAQTFGGSVTLGMGQFCTNPGLLLGIRSAALDHFAQLLGEAIAQCAPQKMLHAGIHEAYEKGRSQLLSQQGVAVVNQGAAAPAELEAHPVLARVDAKDFLANHLLQEEVFGPSSLLIVCGDKEELKTVLKSLKGQLTTTVAGTEADIAAYMDVVELQTTLAGRVILNAPPTGVEVCAAMVHGGPYPATTDARFTSVGTSAIKRWVRPVCFQGFADNMLPDALKQDNPLGIWRLVDNEYRK